MFASLAGSGGFPAFRSALMTVSLPTATTWRGVPASRPGGREGIALAHVTGVEPGAEPAHALGRGAVGERLRRDLAPRLPLGAVAADGGRRLEPGRHVGRCAPGPWPRAGG